MMVAFDEILVTRKYVFVGIKRILEQRVLNQKILCISQRCRDVCRTAVLSLSISGNDTLNC